MNVTEVRLSGTKTNAKITAVLRRKTGEKRIDAVVKTPSRVFKDKIDPADTQDLRDWAGFLVQALEGGKPTPQRTRRYMKALRLLAGR